MSNHSGISAVLGVRSMAALALLGLLSTDAVACLWDYDTLRDERRGLPGVAEILAGRFERHSKFFYEKRVEAMNALIAREPGDRAAYDNLAVAYEKLGNQDAAIEVMLRKEKLAPGEYTTHANLGTFYMHKGDMDRGIEHIRKALQINPSAHFGREEYQLQVAEYYRDAKADPTLLTRMNFLEHHLRKTGKYVPQMESATTRPASEAAVKGPFDLHWSLAPHDLSQVGLKENVTDGLVGIIRFGTGTSAELFLALGDVLHLRGHKALAYRAYKRARDLNHPRKDYLSAVMASIEDNAGHTSTRDSISDAGIKAERADADAWVAAFQTYEDDLLRAGKDVNDETNYAAFYAAHGKAQQELGPEDRPHRWGIYILAGVILFLVIAIPVVIIRLGRRRAVSLFGMPGSSQRGDRPA